MPAERQFECFGCKHRWSVPYGTGRPQNCPQCGSTNIHRAAEDRGYARRRPGAAAGPGGRGPSEEGRGRGGVGRGPPWA